MIAITINIVGPGGAISAETYAIAQLFEKAGYQIEIQDEFAFKQITEKEVTMKTLKKRAKTVTLRIKADHRPWGG